MKTFKTEKHNIPEGASYFNYPKNTHFSLFPNLFINSWFEHGYLDVQISGGLADIKPIPQTKEVEWVNGDRVVIQNPEGFGTWDEANKYLGAEGVVMAVFENTNGKMVAAVSHDDNVCICWMLSMLSKPETETERVERERLENGQSLYELVQSLWCTVDSKYTPHPYGSPMVDDKTKEMYARLARAVDYRKESE